MVARPRSAAYRQGVTRRNPLPLAALAIAATIGVVVLIPNEVGLTIAIAVWLGLLAWFGKLV